MQEVDLIAPAVLPVLHQTHFPPPPVQGQHPPQALTLILQPNQLPNNPIIMDTLDPGVVEAGLQVMNPPQLLDIKTIPEQIQACRIEITTSRAVV